MEKSVKNFFLLAALIAFASVNSSAQNFHKKNSIYAELLGNGFIYSINYDREFSINEKFKFLPRVGAEYLPLSHRQINEAKYKRFHFLVEANIASRLGTSNTNHLETSLGVSFFNIVTGYRSENGELTASESKMARATMLRLGYRHQKPSGGFMYRAGILAKLSQDNFSRQIVGDDLFYMVWPGISIGYSF